MAPSTEATAARAALRQRLLALLHASDLDGALQAGLMDYAPGDDDGDAPIAETQAQIAAVEDRIAASEQDPEKCAPRTPRKARALPESLPRVERVLEPENIV